MPRQTKLLNKHIRDLKKHFSDVTFEIRQEEGFVNILFSLGPSDIGNRKNQEFYVTMELSPMDYPLFPPRIFVYLDPSRSKLIVAPWHQYPDNSLCLFPENDPQQGWDLETHTLVTIIDNLILFLRRYSSGEMDTIWSSSPAMFIVKKTTIDKIRSFSQDGRWGRFFFLSPLGENPLYPIRFQINLITRVTDASGHHLSDFFKENDQSLLTFLGGKSSLSDEEIMTEHVFSANVFSATALPILRLATFSPEYYEYYHFYLSHARSLLLSPLEQTRYFSNKENSGLWFFISDKMFEKIETIQRGKQFDKTLNQILSKHRIPPRFISQHYFFLFVSQNHSTIFLKNSGRLRMKIHEVDLFKNLSDSYGEIKPLLNHFRSKTITVVGLGSIGSTVTLLLAKSQVGNYYLWDYDFVEPKNIPRHATDLSSSFKPKVNEVGIQILVNNPHATIHPYMSNPLEPPASHNNFFIDSARQSDAILFCGVPPRDERLLSELLMIHNVQTPIFYISTNYNAALGEIYGVSPGESGCWNCLRKWRNDNPNSFPRIDLDQEMGPIHYSNSNWPGLGVDVFSIAAFGAKLVLQTLCLDFENKTLIPMSLRPKNNGKSMNYMVWCNSLNHEKYYYGINFLGPLLKHSECEWCASDPMDSPP